jgi:eukaryotic-like serine/threonine-protein kinase
VPETVIAGRYRLLEPLGKGAMSVVWLAEDSELGRRVAVKVLGPDAARDRFDREARAAASLSHPHICRLYDYGAEGGRAYMVLEYLDGGSLEDRLRAHEPDPLPDGETQRVAGEVASGLAHAHERGLVHRDLKPANVLFDAEGRAKIADFGIARVGGGGTLTEAGTVLGTASYISPEQAAGRPASPASDVYSFGVVLFRMLTGRLPFTSRNAMELVRMHRDDPPPYVADVRADAPQRLARVTDAALAKDPASRPPDGTALAAELRGATDDATTVLGGPAEPATVATQVLRPPQRAARSRRAPLPLVAAIVLLLVAAGAALAFFATRDDDEPALPTAPVSLPSAPPVATTAPETTATQETEPETTVATTTAPETATAPAPTTTAPATTAPVTPPPITLPPVTTIPPATTTAPATTVEPATTTIPTIPTIPTTAVTTDVTIPGGVG